MSSIAVNAITNAAGGNTATINGMTPTADSLQGFRNRILNGSMVIDQRNAGASVTPTTSGTYTIDRWIAGLSQASKFSVQQSSTAPTGFTNSLLVTSLSAYSVGSSETFLVGQYIEGFNVADLGWGAAGAQTVTLSFWVRSSLTGTFGGAARNSAGNRSYPFSYTISTANTWEQKTVTIAGDTTGTWLKNNGAGLNIIFSLGTGATLSGTSGSWAGANYLSATGAVSVVGTSGATFRITGVQLEAGSVATPFERRPYGTELQLCMRYFIRINDPGGTGVVASGAVTRVTFPLPVPMRSSITLTAPSTYNFYDGSSIATGTINSYFPGATNLTPQVDFTVAGLTLGRAGSLFTNGGSQFITASAEL